MIACLLIASLVAVTSNKISETRTPYKFEIDAGPILEFKGGGSFYDSDDAQSVNSGVRLSWSFMDITDSYLSAEIEFTYSRAFEDKQIVNQSTLYEVNKNKYLGSANLVFVEAFNPMAYRLAIGGGVERRELIGPTGTKVQRYRPTGNLRLGLGGFVSKDIGIFFDYSIVSILNRSERKMFSGFNLSTNQDLSLSLQAIF